MELGKYFQIFEESGFDEVDHILEITNDELKNDLDMKPFGDRKKLLTLIQTRKQQKNMVSAQSILNADKGNEEKKKDDDGGDNKNRFLYGSNERERGRNNKNRVRVQNHTVLSIESSVAMVPLNEDNMDQNDDENEQLSLNSKRRVLRLRNRGNKQKKNQRYKSVTDRDQNYDQNTLKTSKSRSKSGKTYKSFSDTEENDDDQFDKQKSTHL